MSLKLLANLRLSTGTKIMLILNGLLPKVMVDLLSPDTLFKRKRKEALTGLTLSTYHLTKQALRCLI